jgi:hypothetical protein
MKDQKSNAHTHDSLKIGPLITSRHGLFFIRALLDFLCHSAMRNSIDCPIGIVARLGFLVVMMAVVVVTVVMVVVAMVEMVAVVSVVIMVAVVSVVHNRVMVAAVVVSVLVVAKLITRRR